MAEVRGVTHCDLTLGDGVKPKTLISKARDRVCPWSQRNWTTTGRNRTRLEQDAACGASLALLH